MTPSLLDNELVRKYFGCDALHGQCDCHDHGACRAANILNAMQQPIRKGERYLYINHFDLIIVEAYVGHPEFISDIPKGYHPHYLRLPDAFQKQECKHSWISKCETCGLEQDSICVPVEPAPSPEMWDGLAEACKPKDAVEEKINNIIFNEVDLSTRSGKGLETQLRDLVRLAKESVPECEGDH